MAPTTIAVLNGTSRVNQHIIHQALAKGQQVRAIVRSTSRFYAGCKKHDDLSAHVWTDFNDLTTLAPILDGVDVIYVALCAPTNAVHKPSWLNAEAVASICTVLHNKVAPGSRSKTKVVLLSAHSAQPGEVTLAVAEAVLGHQFNDLRAAQQFLLKQQDWLDVAFVAPGLILDGESSDDAPSVAAVRLSERGPPPSPITYARLAAAMQTVGGAPEWSGKFIVPHASTPIKKSIKDFSAPASGIQAFFKYMVLPYVAKTMAWTALGGGIGYVLGSRDGGAWALRVLGVNVRNGLWLR